MDNLDKVLTAFLTAQSTMKNPELDCRVQHGRVDFRYASLGSCLKAALPPLNAQGIAVVQYLTQGDDQSVTVTTTLIHAASGQEISNEVTIPHMPNDPKSLGSAITYGKRYGLTCLLGLVGEDDDDADRAVGVPPEEVLDIVQDFADAKSMEVGAKVWEALSGPEKQNPIVVAAKHSMKERLA